MKNIFVSAAALFIFSLMACNSPSGAQTDAADSSKVVPVQSSNSDATNSSTADTSYPKKDTMTTKGDSVRKEK